MILLLVLTTLLLFLVARDYIPFVIDKHVYKSILNIESDIKYLNGLDKQYETVFDGYVSTIKN